MPIRTILDEIKAKANNPEELKTYLKDNFETTKTEVSKRVNEVAKQTKDTQLYSDFVVPAASSETTEKALRYIEDKFKGTPLADTLRGLQKKIIDSKADEAKPVESTVDEQAATSDVPVNTETTENVSPIESAKSDVSDSNRG